MPRNKSDTAMLREMAEFGGAEADGLKARLLLAIGGLYDPDRKSRLQDLLRALDDHTAFELCFGSKQFRTRNRGKRGRQ